jgi:hypothetical protein
MVIVVGVMPGAEAVFVVEVLDVLVPHAASTREQESPTAAIAVALPNLRVSNLSLLT